MTLLSHVYRQPASLPPPGYFCQACLAVMSWLLPLQYTYTDTHPPPVLPCDDCFKQIPLSDLNSQKSHCWWNPYKNMQASGQQRDHASEMKRSCWEWRIPVASADYVSLTHGSIVSVEAYRGQAGRQRLTQKTNSRLVKSENSQTSSHDCVCLKTEQILKIMVRKLT